MQEKIPIHFVTSLKIEGQISFFCKYKKIFQIIFNLLVKHHFWLHIVHVIITTSVFFYLNKI